MDLTERFCASLQQYQQCINVSYTHCCCINLEITLKLRELPQKKLLMSIYNLRKELSHDHAKITDVLCITDNSCVPSLFHCS